MQLMSTQSGGRVRVTSDRLLPLYDVGRHTLWPAVQPRRGRRREDDAPAGSTGGLRGLRGGLVLDRHPWPDDLGFPLPWCPQEAVLQEIEVCTAKHLPLQHFEAIDVAFDGAVAPGQREPCFDGGIVVAQPLRKALQGRPRTGRGAGEPAIEALRLAGPYEVGKVRASVTASASSGCCAASCANCCSSSGVRVSGRRRTSHAVPRGVRWPCWGSATTGSGCSGGGWRGASPCACRRRWA